MLTDADKRIVNLFEVVLDSTLHHLKKAANAALSELGYSRDTIKAQVFSTADFGGFYCVEVRVAEEALTDIFLADDKRHQIEEAVFKKTQLIADYMHVRVVWSIKRKADFAPTQDVV